MGNFILKTFGRGLLFVLPIIICLYILFIFFKWADSFTRDYIVFFFPGITYVPGMGIVLGCVLIFAVGLLMSNNRLKKWVSALEMPFKNVPLIKSVYSAIKDLTTYFAPSEGRRANRVVVVKWPDSSTELIGFLTREDMSDMPEGVSRENRVAVYLPMSYQVGGFTVFVPKECVEEVDIPIEEAMRATLTAWLPGSTKEPEEN